MPPVHSIKDADSNYRILSTKIFYVMMYLQNSKKQNCKNSKN